MSRGSLVKKEIVHAKFEYFLPSMLYSYFKYLYDCFYNAVVSEARRAFCGSYILNNSRCTGGLTSFNTTDQS